MPHQETLKCQVLEVEPPQITGPLGVWSFPVLNSLSKSRPPGPGDFGEEAGGMVPRPEMPPHYLPESPVPFVTHGTYLGERTQTHFWVIGFPEWNSYSVYVAEDKGNRKRDLNAIRLWYDSIEEAAAAIARIF